MPWHLGAFILSSSKTILNKFVFAIEDDKVCYTDTDSLYIEKKLVISREKSLVGKELGRGKNDYGDCGIFYGLFITPKVNFCPTINEYGKIEKRHLKGFQDADRLLQRKKYFPIIWKSSFDVGDEIRSKVRNCKDCLKSENKTCQSCEEKIYQHKEFKAHLDELKRKSSNEEMKN